MKKVYQLFITNNNAKVLIAPKAIGRQSLSFMGRFCEKFLSKKKAPRRGLRGKDAALGENLPKRMN
jgi:hypothetical protein